MDLIYTNAQRVDQGVLSAYGFDLSFGASENDFEITLGASEPTLEFGAFIYIEGTEYGGIIDTIETASDSETVTYGGRTWHGIINSKVMQPNSGDDYFYASGDANQILAMMITRLGLDDLFAADSASSGITIKNYKFTRYCTAYDGICRMLSDNKAKLVIEWHDRSVLLRAESIVDYTDQPIDGDMASLEVYRCSNKVNHLICLGRGDLAEREVIHLYVDQFGRIGDTQFYTGLNEVVDVYDNTSAESSDDLRSGGISRLKELLDVDSAELSLNESEQMYDIGDIVGALDIKSGNSVAAAVTQKIVKINNGTIRTEYKTGR